MAACRFLLGFVWISLTLYRTSLSCDSSNPSQEACGCLLFAPTHFLAKGSSYAAITGFGNERSHLRPFLQRRWPAFSNHYWLLLLAGDVEVNPGPSTFPSTAYNVPISRGPVDSAKSHRPGTLKCCLLNARSVVNKSLDLQALIHCQGLDLLAVTETFLSDTIHDGELVGAGYSVYRRDRDRHGGGVMLIIRDSIAATRRYDLETDCELLWVELTSPLLNVLVGVFYNPPGFKDNALLQLQNSLTSLPSSLPIVLCGDFNLPNINWCHPGPFPSSNCAAATLMCDLVNEYNLQQMVLEPTRESHILDLVFTNTAESLFDVSVVDNLPGTDHDAVVFATNYQKHKPSLQRRWTYNFKKADFVSFRELLSKVSWDCCFLSDSINDCWINFRDLLLSVADQCIPRAILRSKKSMHWLSRETLHLIRKKRRVYKLAKRSGKPHHFQSYRDISNKVRSLTREDHRHHLNQITSNLQNDQRPFWRWLKYAKGQHSCIPDLHHQGSILSTPKEKAVAFSNHFNSIFVQENTSLLSTLREELRSSWSSEEVNDIVILREDVYDLLCKLDVTKAAGPDEVPARLLREGAVWLAKPLATLFTLSLSQGCLPSDWTSANITPVFKKGNKHLITNYRPISLTSTVVKLLERLVHCQLTDFLESNNKLSPLQHGFRTGHSCQTQLLETVHKWACCLDRASSSHVVFTDFSKAFDTVPHERLLLKLEHVGIRGRLLTWISSFLLNRTQRVLIDGAASEWCEVTSGVPQGSILGPLLFIIYINDIGKDLSSHTGLFADDCTISTGVSSYHDCLSLQDDLNSLFRWANKWQLALNTSKCKVMCISRKRNPPTFQYHINNNNLEWVETFKYLGVKLNNKLTWDDHTLEVTSKAQRVLNLLRRTMYGCPRNAKIRAYTALVRPHLEYCAPVWTPNQQKLSCRLEKVQKRAARWICGVPRKSDGSGWTRSYSDLCSELNWMSLEQRRRFLIYCQMFKILHNLDCIKSADYFITKSRALRSHPYSVIIPHSRTNVFRYSFFINASNLWHALPLNLVQLTSLKSFKSNLVNFLLS